MVIVMKESAGEADVEYVVERLRRLGLAVHRSTGDRRIILGAVGDTSRVDENELAVLPGVHDIIRITDPFKLASRTFRPEGTVIRAGPAEIGGTKVVMMAGPCTIESEEQVRIVAGCVARAGATVLRGGAFKPRTSPYSFQGLGAEGLRILRRAADEHGLAVVSEVMEVAQIPLLEEFADILQVGARNAQNFPLLRALGRTAKPVLLKRGMATTIEEWLMAAEYVMAGGNHRVILCERGIRTFETANRSTLDLAAIPVVKRLSHLPLIVDPSHAMGMRDKVAPMALAAVAAGADGLLVEVHNDPEHALCDGAQSLYPEQFERMFAQLRQVAAVIERSF
jgi:3-deoxy-7-phosphoheptulonate synthase